MWPKEWFTEGLPNITFFLSRKVALTMTRTGTSADNWHYLLWNSLYETESIRRPKIVGITVFEFPFVVLTSNASLFSFNICFFRNLSLVILTPRLKRQKHISYFGRTGFSRICIRFASISLDSWTWWLTLERTQAHGPMRSRTRPYMPYVNSQRFAPCCPLARPSRVTCVNRVTPLLGRVADQQAAALGTLRVHTSFHPAKFHRTNRNYY